MANNNPESNAEIERRGWLPWFIGRRIRMFYNKSRWGEKYGKVPILARSGRPEKEVIAEEYKYLFTKNELMTSYLRQIEDRWRIVETKLFGAPGFDFGPEPQADNISDEYRSLEYFRNEESTHLEANIFEQSGTVEITTKDLPLTPAEIKNMVRGHIQRVKELEEKQKKGERLSDIESAALQNTLNLLQDQQRLQDSVNELTIGILPNIEINEVNLTFLDGTPEKIIGIGSSRLVEISEKFDTVGKRIDHFSSTHKIGADVRTELGALFRTIKEGLTEINTFEDKHAKKLKKIYATLVSLNSYAQGELENFRPEKGLIRFSHTYKIIKPYRVIAKDEDGNIIPQDRIEEYKEHHPDKNITFETKYFKDEYREFTTINFRKWDDEIEIGLDENGWPLEVQKVSNMRDLTPVQVDESGIWIVLTDRWWHELSQNDWHKETILNKPGGLEIWKNKVASGVSRHGIRTVPNEYIGDVDPLDKINFISNETDAFRDDYRDGRWHPHSKSIMDYLIASTNGIMPTRPVNLNLDTTSPDTRIRFKPIYYTRSRTKWQKKVKGEVNPGGGLGRITEDMIPEDERKVTRRYELEVEVRADGITEDRVIGKDENGNDIVKHFLENRVRSPSHLNPAFDRAALNHTFIHWGRMLYYETVDGVNKWSENPFPHITTRGIAKYLIDLTLRKTFSFNEARRILKGHQWDYGVRHYGDPDLPESYFTRDPLGPSEGEGGVLWHAREIARKRGG